MSEQSTSFDLGVEEIASPDALKASFAEMLATALFVFVGVGCIASFVASAGPSSAIIDALPVIALTHGFAIALLAAGIGAISGGHINPAVTFAFIITGRITVVRGIMYIIAQLIGACIGMALLRALLVDEVILAIPGAGGHSINDTIVTKPLYALGLEAVGTFILVWTIFATAVTRRGNSGTLAPLYIGLAVAVLHFVLVPMTGCGLNPARTFGPALINGRFGGGIDGTPDIWIFFIGPLIGAALAGMSYYILYLMSDEDAEAELAA